MPMDGLYHIMNQAHAEDFWQKSFPLKDCYTLHKKTAHPYITLLSVQGMNGPFANIPSYDGKVVDLVGCNNQFSYQQKSIGPSRHLLLVRLLDLL